MSAAHSTTGFAYDANGNTLSDAQGRSFTWDFENRLTQAVVPNVGTTTFRYDPFGRRIQKSGPLGTTNYVYDATDIVEELDGVGGVLATYMRTQGVDDTGDSRGRFVHGGGSSLPDPYTPFQPLKPTHGCTRGHNQDVRDLGIAITTFQNTHPGTPIIYCRQ